MTRPAHDMDAGLSPTLSPRMRQALRLPLDADNVQLAVELQRRGLDFGEVLACDRLSEAAADQALVDSVAMIPRDRRGRA